MGIAKENELVMIVAIAREKYIDGGIIMKHAVVILFSLLALSGCSPHDGISDGRETIIFFGDSITELGDKPNGYVAIVRDSLNALGVQANVRGAGISGNKVTDLRQRLHKDVLALKPSIVFIYIGINDVWHYQFSDRGLSGTPKDLYKKVLTEIIRTIQKTGAQVVLATPSVIGEKNNGTNRWDPMLDEYAEISRTIARSEGVALMDLRKDFISYLKLNNPSGADKNILTYDGVHLNDSGNRFVAGRVLSMLDGLGLFFPKK